MRQTWTVRKEQLSETLKTIDSLLEQRRLDKKERIRTMLMTEETLVQLFASAPEGEAAKVSVSGSFGITRVSLSIRGAETELLGGAFLQESFGVDINSAELGTETEDAIRGLLLRSFEDRIRFRRRDGRNTVRISAGRSQYTLLYMTLGAMALGIVLGFLLKLFCSPEALTELDNGVLKKVTELFMNVLQTMVAPMVFFSIASSLGGFGSLSDMGKIGGKVIAMYLFTSVVSIVVGIVLSFIFQPGDPSLATTVTDSSFTADTSGITSVTIGSMLMGIIPTNFLQPFLESNMLQIIFLAVLFGLGANAIGSLSHTVQDFVRGCNETFMKITMLIINLIPLVSFCSMMSMTLSLGGSALLSVLGILFVILLGLAVVMVFLLLLLSVCTRLNPIHFLRKYAPTMLQVFTICSSNASIPLNMKACGENLGISPRVYAFSIPLGATINMNGLCVYFSVCALAFAHIFGVEITGSMLLSMSITIIATSMGTPGIPGIAIVVLAVLLTQFNIPVAAIGMVVGITSLLDMFITAVNCFGDVTTSFIVAKSEGLLNEDVFRQP